MTLVCGKEVELPNPKDDRAVFNYVKNHLLTQGCKSQNDQMCLYRGPYGTSCAVGCLIPDKDYRPNFEGKAITRNYTNHEKDNYGASIYIEQKGYNIDLLKQLQAIHDNTSNVDLVDSFKRRLDELERTFITLKPAAASP